MSIITGWKTSGLLLAVLLLAACGDNGNSNEGPSTQGAMDAAVDEGGGEQQSGADDEQVTYFAATGSVEASVAEAHWGVTEQNDAIDLMLFETVGSGPKVMFSHIPFDSGGQSFELLDPDSFARNPVEARFMTAMDEKSIYQHEVSGTLEITELLETMSGTFEFTAQNSDGEEAKVAGAFSGVTVPTREE